MGNESKTTGFTASKETKKQVKLDVARIKMLKAELGKVRCWLSGFNHARPGTLDSIPGSDSLRMTQQFLAELLKDE
jgi:hypothetical protein